MSEDFYKQALEKALEELSDVMSQREELDSQREELDHRIIQLRKGVFGLTAIAGIETDEVAKTHPDLFPDLLNPDVGFTDAVRDVLKAHRSYHMSPIEVRNSLRIKGFDLSKYKNVLASIHTILKRLQESREVDVMAREGKSLYKWKI